MHIALIAHDTKKELLMQFCIAYRSILGQNELYATGRTGRLVSGATGLHVHCFWPGSHGGAQQIAARIACGEVDMLLLFRDVITRGADEPDDQKLLRLCDVYNVPCATNIATAEVLVRGLERETQQEESETQQEQLEKTE